MWEIILWASLFVILTVSELATYQLISIWFAIGALIALICAVFNVGFGLQILIFTVVAAFLLIITRPFVKKLQANKHVPTNSELDVGKTAIVIQKINNNELTGRVRINGIDWNARSVDSSIIDVDSNVIVEEVDGAKLLVKKL